MADLHAELTAARLKVAEYLAAESEALQAQEMRFTSPNSGMDRAEVMADLAEIRRGITYWRRIVGSLEARINGQPTFGGMPFTSARFGDYSGD